MPFSVKIDYAVSEPNNYCIDTNMKNIQNMSISCSYNILFTHQDNNFRFRNARVLICLSTQSFQVSFCCCAFCSVVYKLAQLYHDVYLIFRYEFG